MLGFGPRRSSKSGAETETFECLVEDEDDVEDVEFGASYGKSESDEDGMEDDAEFEDEDGGHLCGIVFRFVRMKSGGSDGGRFGIRRVLINFNMIPCVT